MSVLNTLMKLIDQFAGAGGNSHGAALAGHEVIWAGNHDEYAIEAHKQNHPQAMHICEDLIGYNYHTVPDHDVLMSFPACQGHSKSQPRRRRYHERLGSTAWATVQCLDIKCPNG